jgi:hypothetical protein
MNVSKNMRRIEPTEHQIQSAIVSWASNVFVDHPNGRKVLLRPYLIKITNEGKRSLSQGKKMKDEGLTKGASDLFLAFPVYRSVNAGCSCCYDNEEFYGLWYEVKAPGKKPTKIQFEFLSVMKDLGYCTGWGDSVDKAIKDFKDYLGMK